MLIPWTRWIRPGPGLVGIVPRYQRYQERLKDDLQWVEQAEIELVRRCIAEGSRHPSTEAIWDLVLSAGVDVFGTATDDAHHYDDAPKARARREPVYVGDLGFVMVRARKEPGASVKPWPRATLMPTLMPRPVSS